MLSSSTVLHVQTAAKLRSLHCTHNGSCTNCSAVGDSDKHISDFSEVRSIARKISLAQNVGATYTGVSECLNLSSRRMDKQLRLNQHASNKETNLKSKKNWPNNYQENH